MTGRFEAANEKNRECPMIRSAIGIAVLFTSVAACAGTPQRTESGKTTNKPRENMVVQINNMTIHPQVVRVQGAKNSIAWTNFSDYYATVHFPASVKDGFTCTELRPDFVVNGPSIESVVAVGANEDLVTPCPMKPGSSPYTVYLFKNQAYREAPQLTVTGSIEVLK